MNVVHRDKIVLLGLMSHYPVAGVAWQTLHYLVGFQRLGYEVYYVEAHGCTPSKLMRTETDDGATRAAEYIADVMGRFDLGDRWAYHARYPESRHFGMSELQLNELYGSAALLINLHGSHLPTPELSASGRLVYLGTDPVDVEVDLFHHRQETVDYLAPHAAFFTYGENIGKPDSLVPTSERFRFHATRQPVVMDFWEGHGDGDGTAFTTIGNWRQPWREVNFNGEIYRWSKHVEFQKFLELPRRVPQLFELALASYDENDRRLLENAGWRVRPALDFSRNLELYRRYIGGSRGEFTVAKEQNVRLRSGWFSDRAATYLATGRPVITQETGFSNYLPTGKGLFAFSTIEGIIDAVQMINGDYEDHRRAATTIARDYFRHDIVLGRFLRDLGESPPSTRTAVRTSSNELPSTLVLSPVSRWPTRLPEETVRTALALPMPLVAHAEARARPHATVVIVTHGGLHFTKMCLVSLLSSWHRNDELVIVDNASVDGTRDYLQEVARRNPFVRTFFNERNRGFAAANNQGLAQATGDVLILLNNDTLLPRGWRDGLLRWLDDPTVGLVGPVTNRTCNEAQIDAPYRTYGEYERFVHDYTRQRGGVGADLRMLAFFCVALRRELLERVGPLDEQFEVGMFEDDDYAMRVGAAGYRIVCAEDVFVHHFGQGSLGELCATGEFDRVLEGNRRRFEVKWGMAWQPHGRRITPEYRRLRERIARCVASTLPPEAMVIVISKGDDELLRLGDRRGWHFPQLEDGNYANVYPADSAEAIIHLESLRIKRADFLVIPKPAFWWLDYYGEFKRHLENRYPALIRDPETCILFDLRGPRG